MTNNEKENEELLILDDNLISTEPEELIMEDNLLSSDDDTSLITFDDDVSDDKTKNNLGSSEDDLLIMDDKSENLLMDDSSNISSNNFEEVMLDKMQSEKEVNTEEPSLDLGIDLLGENEDTTKESKKVEEKPEMSLNTDSNILIDLGNEDNKSNVESTLEPLKEEIFDLDTATAAFILQLNSRKDKIVDLIRSDNDYISDLEEKIKSLKAKVEEYKNSIKEFNTENEKIDAKIKLLK